MRTLLLAGLLVAASPAIALGQNTPSDAELLERAAHLDDDPDPLHADYTPAVYPLCDAAARGALLVVDRLDSPDAMTRLHAERVVECVAMRWLGWAPGRGFPDGQVGDERARELMRQLGSYSAQAEPAARRAALALWRRWLEARRGQPYPPPPRPWPEQISAGMSPALAPAARCLPAGVPSVRVQVTLGRDGSVTRVVVWSELSDRSARRCVARAVRTGRVPPFSGEPITFLTRVGRLR